MEILIKIKSDIDIKTATEIAAEVIQRHPNLTLDEHLVFTISGCNVKSVYLRRTKTKYIVEV